jgi:uncharacterized protein DUF998
VAQQALRQVSEPVPGSRVSPTPVLGWLVPLASLGALVLGAALLLALHVMPPTDQISPIRRTLSQYALSPNKWIFDLAVVLVAIGSALAFGELVRRGLVRALSFASVFGLLWTASLTTVVVFTKNNWAVGPSMGGMIHRYASLVAFLSLPLAVIITAGVVFPSAPGWRWLVRGLGLTSLAWFGLIMLGVLNMFAGGGPWWQFVPLGLVERIMAATAVAAMAVIVVGLAMNRHAPRAGGRPGLGS